MAKEKHSVLALVTARGGSKGVPRKNVMVAGGKPLISWTIEASLRSTVIDQTVLSSDDDEIINVAEEWGCKVPFRRPAELATDYSSSMDVVLHALDHLPGYQYVVLLQPTSPQRTAEDIDAAFELMISSGAPSCVSVCEAEESPYWMFRVNEGKKLERLLSDTQSINRRQDLPPFYVLNGAIYIADVKWLRESKSFLGEGCVAYLMPKDRSIDIDTIEDFELFCQSLTGLK